MFYNYNQRHDFEYNECSGRGMCSITPKISSFQEVMFILTRAAVYYLLKLEKMSYDCADIKFDIVKGISNLIANTSYTDEQLLEQIICKYNDLIHLKREYLNLCKERNILCRDLNIPIKLSPDMVLSDVLNQGQKAIARKFNKVSKEQKSYTELLFVIVKSVSLSILKLSDYDVINSDAINLVIETINLFNQKKTDTLDIKKYMTELAKMDVELWQMRNKIQIETFGEISQTKVSLSTEPGKALLVSGSNLKDLYNLLNALKDEKLDIYSHGDLLIAHAFENFKKFKNFKGHYGTFNDNCVLDFATFPGSILLTKHATQNIEYLIRGRLYTTGDVPPKGVIPIVNNDFRVLVESANKSKGFSKGRKKDDVIIGFNLREISDKFAKLKEKIDSGEIKRIFIIGMANTSSEMSDYFNTLSKHVSKDTYVISFSYLGHYENILHINIANNFPMQLLVLEELFKHVPITYKDLTVFLTKCDANTLSSIIGLKDKGIKNIYLADCPPTVINPAIINSFMQLYDIKTISNPLDDLENM